VLVDATAETSLVTLGCFMCPGFGFATLREAVDCKSLDACFLRSGFFSASGPSFRFFVSSSPSYRTISPSGYQITWINTSLLSRQLDRPLIGSIIPLTLTTLLLLLQPLLLGLGSCFLLVGLTLLSEDATRLLIAKSRSFLLFLFLILMRSLNCKPLY
jgi:hypothetical protein